MDKRFLYEVRPLRQIVIPGKPAQKRAFTALLTIAEVKEYMKYGPVYRKYADANIPMVQVTGANIYNLHQEYSPKKVINRPGATEPIVDENNEPETTVTVETIDDAPVVEESESKKLNEEESTSTDNIPPVEEIIPEDNAESTSDEVIDTQENVNDDADVNDNEYEEEVVNSEEDTVEESVTEEPIVEDTLEESEPIVEEQETSEGTNDEAEQEEVIVDDNTDAEEDSQTEDSENKTTGGYNNSNIQFNTSGKKYKK